MPLNQPQIRVCVGGVVLPGVISAEVEQVGYFAADRFSLLAAIGAVSEGGVAYFAALGGQTLTIEAAISPAGFATLMTGRIDNIRCDLLNNTATLSGRDLSALLIDNEISETFANQTASQIALAIASRHGLTANVATTKTPVGQYYEMDHARSALGVGSRAGTEWNLLAWLAMIEGFALSVTGTTLNFAPISAAAPLLLVPGDCIELTLDVAATIPKTTTVKSWNTRNKVAVTQTSGAGQGLATTLVRPNLTAQQAMGYASNYQASLAQHETILTATIPGELTLGPNAAIALAGTNSSFDQTYIVDSIRRSLDARRGFVEFIRAHAIV